MSDTLDGAAHEDSFVRAFVSASRRERTSFELRERRGRFFDRFSHDAIHHLDARYVERIPPPNSDPASLARLLRSKGATSSCYAISSRRDLDARLLPLEEALELCVGYGLPTILSCVPGRLGYLEAEQVAGLPERFLLLRPSSLDPADA